MKKTFSTFTLIACSLLLSACNNKPADVAIDRGNPERLVDMSSEAVTLSLGSKKSLTKLSNMVAKDAPARAELSCSLKNINCSQAKEILERHSIPVRIVGEKNNNVILSYERTVVRDCNPRYADNMYDDSRNNHPAFGCAVAGNMVQMVSDRKQFTSPALLDFPDAAKGEQTYQSYMKPAAKSSSASSGASNSSSSATPPAQ